MEAYIDDKKKLYNAIVDFLEASDEMHEDKLQLLTDIFSIQKIEGDKEEMHQFLHIIKNISDNHHRESNFIKKIDRIFQNFKEQIKQTLSNDEIFSIFESNKILLLNLLKSEIITLTDSIYKKMMNKIEQNGLRFCFFFYKEIEKFVGEEKIESVKNELLQLDPNIFENYGSNREEGENNSFICSLIRKDQVEEFISHVNRTNYSLSSTINPSIFETNSFLIENKNTSLIEYAAFFGSIQIFQYLLMNKVELKPSLWLYVIHSKNAELIHILESNQIHPPNLTMAKIDNDNDDDDDDDDEEQKEQKNDSNNSYLRCLIESIKCHHNDIAEYIEINLLDQSEKEAEDIISNSIKYHNFKYFRISHVLKHEFFYFYYYNYKKLVDLLLEKKKEEIESKIIQKNQLF